MVNFVPPNASALALTRHGDIAGTAAAVIGATQAGVSGIVSPLSGLLGGDAVAMAGVMLGAAVGAPCSSSRSAPPPTAATAPGRSARPSGGLTRPGEPLAAR